MEWSVTCERDMGQLHVTVAEVYHTEYLSYTLDISHTTRKKHTTRFQAQLERLKLVMASVR